MTLSQLTDDKMTLALSTVTSLAFVYGTVELLPATIDDIAKNCLNNAPSPSSFFTPCVVSGGITCGYALALLAVLATTVYCVYNVGRTFTLLSNTK